MNLKYKSTRSADKTVTASEAILKGLADDGGLFVPEELPQISYQELCTMQTMNYTELAQHILAKFLTDFTA